MLAGLLLAWLAYFVTSSEPAFVLSVFVPTVLSHALIGALALAYAGWLIMRRRLPGPTLLDLPVLGLLLVYAAAIGDSIYPRVSWEAALLTGAAVLVYYAFHDLPITTDTLVRILVATAGIAGVVALYRVGAEYVRWLELVSAVDGSISTSNLLPPSVPRVSGVGGHVNIIAMAFNLAIPFAGALVLRPRLRIDRWLGLLALIVCTAGLFFTLSRGAWLGTVVAVPVFASLFVLRNRDISAVGARISHRQRMILLAFVAAGLVALVVGIFGISRWDSRPEWLFRASLSARQDAVSVGWRIFRDRPWLGAGPHTYPLLYNIYSGAYPIENVHPHNGYVAALDDTGLAGAAVLTAGGALLLYALWRAYASGDAAKRTLVAAAAAALATLAVHSFVETPNIWRTALFPLALVLAISMRLSPSPLRTSVAPFRYSLAVLPRLAPVALGLSLLSFLFFDIAHDSFATSLKSLRGGDFGGAEREATDAAKADDGFAVYQIHAAVIGATTYELNAEVSDEASPARLDDAIDRLSTAVRQEPRSAIGYANLALVLRLRADTLESEPSRHDTLQAEAVAAAHAAIERAPTDSTIAAVAGTVFEWAKEEADAGEAYALALSHDAGLAQSPFWATNPQRSQLRTKVLKESELSDCEKGQVSVVYAGFRDDLEELASGCRAYLASANGDVRARADLALILIGLGRFDEAAQEATTAASIVPDNPYVRTAVAVTLMPAGDIDRIRHELMLAAYLGDPDAALFLSYTYAPGGIRRSNTVVANLGIPNTPDAIPAAVVKRLEATLGTSAPMFLDHGIQRYRMGILYYRVRFQRESPASILVPGEWITFASPRALLLLAELDFARSDAGRR